MGVNIQREHTHKPSMKKMEFVMESEDYDVAIWCDSLWELKGENRRAKTGSKRVFYFLSKPNIIPCPEWQRS